MKEKTGEAYIQELIKEGEHQQQDFKFEISDVCKIAKSLSAFANTDGGRLLIGVKDNGKIAGVRSEEEQYMIQAAAEIYCVPPVTYNMTTYIVEGKQVLLATILQSERRPVCAKSEDGKLLAYIRIAGYPRAPKILATERKPMWRTYCLYRKRAASVEPAQRTPYADSQQMLQIIQTTPPYNYQATGKVHQIRHCRSRI